MIGNKLVTRADGIFLFLIISIPLGFATLASISYASFELPSILFVFDEILLFLSLFVPGYLIQFALTNKFIHVTLSKGERIASSFGLSLFAISSLSFITSFIGTGLREIFYGYFVASSVMLAIVLVLNRDSILHGLSSLSKMRRLPFDNLFLFSLLFLVIPLFHLFGFAKLNWDGFTFYLKDALAISVSNSISFYYPESFYDGNVPLIFNSYVSSIMYSYGLNVLNINTFEGNVPLLMEYTNIALSFIILATLFAVCLLLRSFSHKVFQDGYLAAAVVIIFLTTPLLNQFLYIWSLYADLFFAFETLLVLVFAFRYLQKGGKDSKYFSLLMIGLGLSLAIATKTYGYVLLLVIPLLFLKGLRISYHRIHLDDRAEPMLTVDEMNNASPHQVQKVGAPDVSYEVRKESVFSNQHLSKLVVLVLLSIIIGFASLYTIRGIMLTGSPFGYTVQTLVNYSDDELWANNVITSSGILQSVENYPLLNQVSSLLLSYGLLPVFMIPLVIGIILVIKKESRGLGIFAIYALSYFVIFVTILELRVDRHLFSVIALLPLISVYGLKAVAGYLGWKREGILYATMILCLFQLPLFDAIYSDFKITSIFPSMYYWYTNSNLVNVLAYSLITFGIAIILTHTILIITKRRYLRPYILAALFGISVLTIIGIPMNNILARYQTYNDYIHTNYQNQHLGYPSALQQFVEIGGTIDPTKKLLYLHGVGTEYLTLAHVSYIKIDDFRMLAGMREVIEEKDPSKVHELLLSKDVGYILYPSESNSHHGKLEALSKVTDNALLFSDPSSITTKKIKLNQWWDLYIV